MMESKLLTELNPKEGDEFMCTSGGYGYPKGCVAKILPEERVAHKWTGSFNMPIGSLNVSRFVPLKRKDEWERGVCWGEMSRKEKGEILLRWQEGEPLQYKNNLGDWVTVTYTPKFLDDTCYRIKEKPVVEFRVHYVDINNLPESLPQKKSETHTHSIVVKKEDGKVVSSELVGLK